MTESIDKALVDILKTLDKERLPIEPLQQPAEHIERLTFKNLPRPLVAQRGRFGKIQGIQYDASYVMTDDELKVVASFLHRYIMINMKKIQVINNLKDFSKVCMYWDKELEHYSFKSNLTGESWRIGDGSSIYKLCRYISNKANSPKYTETDN